MFYISSIWALGIFSFFRSPIYNVNSIRPVNELSVEGYIGNGNVNATENDNEKDGENDSENGKEHSNISGNDNDNKRRKIIMTTKENKNNNSSRCDDKWQQH